MKYVTLMYTDTRSTRRPCRRPTSTRSCASTGSWATSSIASGELIGGMGMAAAEETMLLRLGADGVVAERGPLAAGADVHVSAYYELECESDERAHEIAERLLDDHVTAVELRSVHDSVERRRG